MTRILADLPDDDIEWLDARAAEPGKPRNDFVSDIVRSYAQKLKIDTCAS